MSPEREARIRELAGMAFDLRKRLEHQHARNVYGISWDAQRDLDIEDALDRARLHDVERDLRQAIYDPQESPAMDAGKPSKEGAS